MSSEVLIRAENVSKKFCRSLKRSLFYGLQDMAGEVLGAAGTHSRLRDQEFWAVRSVSFELRRGECLGLIGHNGAGKTTLLKMLNGLIKPDAGQITTVGRTGALIALGAGFNPLLSGRENIYVNGSVLGLSNREIDSKIQEIIDFSEVSEFIDSPVQTYSSGMHVRLGFAVASALNPDILILDEILAVGDTAFRVKCLTRLAEIRRKCATIFVSHDPLQISAIANQVLWLDNGITRESSSDVNGTLTRYESAGIRHRAANGQRRLDKHNIIESLVVNGTAACPTDIVDTNALDPLIINVRLVKLDIDTPDTDYAARLTIVDEMENPILSIRDRDSFRNFHISYAQLAAPIQLCCTLPCLPLADGIYYLRFAITTQGTDAFVCFVSHLCGVRVTGFGHSWGKTVAAASWAWNRT